VVDCIGNFWEIAAHLSEESECCKLISTQDSPSREQFNGRKNYNLSLQNLLDPPFHPVTLADKHRFMSGDVCGCKEKGRDYNECAHLLKCCWNVCLKI
jgi:hypothetical protein